jgi:hypothetical protein
MYNVIKKNATAAHACIHEVRFEGEMGCQTNTTKYHGKQTHNMGCQTPDPWNKEQSRIVALQLE